jgi:hypothetical protein
MSELYYSKNCFRGGKLDTVSVIDRSVTIRRRWWEGEGMQRE